MNQIFVHGQVTGDFAKAGLLPEFGKERVDRVATLLQSLPLLLVD